MVGGVPTTRKFYEELQVKKNTVFLEWCCHFMKYKVVVIWGLVFNFCCEFFIFLNPPQNYIGVVFRMGLGGAPNTLKNKKILSLVSKGRGVAS